MPKGKEFLPTPDMVGKTDRHRRRALPIASSARRPFHRLAQGRWGWIRLCSNKQTVTSASHVVARLAKPCVLQVKAFNRSRNTPFKRSSYTPYRQGMGFPARCIPPPGRCVPPTRCWIACVRQTSIMRGPLVRP